VKDVEVIHKIVFDRPSTNKIKMNHIKIMLCSHYIGIDRLERSKLLQGDPGVGIDRFWIDVSDDGGNLSLGSDTEDDWVLLDGDNIVVPQTPK